MADDHPETIGVPNFLGAFIRLLEISEFIHCWRWESDRGDISYHMSGAIRQPDGTCRRIGIERGTLSATIPALLNGGDQNITQLCLGACGQIKALTQFSKNKNNKVNGRNKYCKQCERRRVSTYNRKNKKNAVKDLVSEFVSSLNRPVTDAADEFVEGGVNVDGIDTNKCPPVKKDLHCEAAVTGRDTGVGGALGEVALTGTPAEPGDATGGGESV